MDAEGQRLAEMGRKWLQECGLADLFPSLRVGLLHTTSLAACLGILEGGSIFPNTGQFPPTYPQSENSYAWFKGCVSLFDFETPSEEDCLEEAVKWLQFFCARPCRVVIHLDRRPLESKLIPNSSARAETGFGTMWIPQVEVWYPEPIPLSAARRLILVVGGEDDRWHSEFYEAAQRGQRQLRLRIAAIRVKLGQPGLQG